VALYFNEVLIAENFVFSLAPMPFTAAMMASEMPAAINPYSIAVAAVSSAQNFRINAIMGWDGAPRRVKQLLIWCRKSSGSPH
jgi:hypothetical protein